MKLLVAVTSYSVPGKKPTHNYVQTRNTFYRDHGIDVTVLNFLAEKDYLIDDIPVITLNTFLKNPNKKNYDILVCHAPNIRNHYRFLQKYEKDFSKIVFFFHGHEVLPINKIYPAPFSFQKKPVATKRLFRDFYDTLKLKIWHGYFPRLAYKSHFVFVSKWMYKEFLNWTKISPSVLEGRYSIIPNSVGKVFKQTSYKSEIRKKYDFISIRANLDGSKYGIDIVNDLAKNNPDLNFIVVGRGKFFNCFEKAQNITWINEVLSHEEILSLLNQSKCGLMPTRLDAQGVMTCEMATFGIPVITSDIPVCHEILEGFENVKFVSNENTTIDLKPILDELIFKTPFKKNTKYFADNTTSVEVELFEKILR